MAELSHRSFQPFLAFWYIFRFFSIYIYQVYDDEESKSHQSIENGYGGLKVEPSLCRSNSEESR